MSSLTMRQICSVTNLSQYSVPEFFEKKSKFGHVYFSFGMCIFLEMKVKNN